MPGAVIIAHHERADAAPLARLASGWLRDRGWQVWMGKEDGTALEWTIAPQWDGFHAEAAPAWVPGASTHTTALALIKHFGVSARPVATGAGAVTLTQAMSGQIDVGWASPPFGLEALQDGKTRLIARGSDAPSTRDQTARVNVLRM